MLWCGCSGEVWVPGCRVQDAAADAGVSVSAGWRWFSEAGGVAPRWGRHRSTISRGKVTVSVEGVRYSVPHQLVDTRVWVRFYGDDQARHPPAAARRVGGAAAALLEVVVAVRAGSDHAGLRGEIEDVPPQRAAVAEWAVQVAGPPAGFGPFLGASLLVGAGDLRAFPSAGHLAAAARTRTRPERLRSGMD